MATSVNRGRASRLSSALGIAAAAGIVVVLTGFLYARVALTQSSVEKSLLTVETVDYRVSASYQRPVSYLGLVVAGRKANLAFEVPGRIATLPVRQGSEVKIGQLLAQLDTASLEARRTIATASLKQVRTELELARLKAQRQTELRASGAVSKEASDETRLSALALEARVEAVTAELTSIEIDIQKSSLRAPYDGVIADHYVYQGAVISPGIPVVRLIETERREAHIGVAAARAGELQVGQNYQLQLRDLPVTAILLSVRPDVDPVTRSTAAVFALDDELESLDGEPVTLTLQESVDISGGWLPIASLLEGERGVWTVLRIVATETGVSTVREGVEVLDIQQDQAYVRGTLEPGARVVASGVHRISPGTAILLEENR
ncbi:MAG: efflux RND transporter periplasmic adaptor subunit [Gammaproteobacteria bacterium]|nr:efflux RND transporter periplasmic adaptor subunit [Gammaproteobacteria bacterium]